ncbi:hypothetical protein AACH06_20415 [Ideonella sp. DXS29W]|uniref:Uncharacterized protein n=1 Tax=Ideonella lacteola TaxID=2984193 RepID=A0ABU9BT89_9BURK
MSEISAQTGPVRLFVRQPFTESKDHDQSVVADVLNQLVELSGHPRRLELLTGVKAQSAATFRSSFEVETGQKFSPCGFRNHRLSLLSKADGFINIRTGMSESSAFELSYHIFRGTCSPILFLVSKRAPIKTTLLQDLQDLCDVTYMEFEDPKELNDGLQEFIARCRVKFPSR